MKAWRLVVWFFGELFPAIIRAYRAGVADVRDKEQREAFERANSGEEVVTEKRSEKK